MKQLKAFQHGDGAHCGLSDWYSDGRSELEQALKEGFPFDTGWYSSKKEIASARIRSEDGVRIKIEVSVSDDFDTEGNGYVSIDEWTLDAVEQAVGKAWMKAEEEGMATRNTRDSGLVAEVDGRKPSWLILDGARIFPLLETITTGGAGSLMRKTARASLIHPSRLRPCKLLKRAHDWCFRFVDEKSLTLGEWTITPWRDNRPLPEDPSDYAGMGWVGRDGRP